MARILIIAVFVPAAISKAMNWTANAAYMAASHVPIVTPLLGAALAIEALGSLSLILGLRARISALVMFFYLVPVTIIFHNFWGGGGVAQTQFLKNAGIMGGLLMVAAYGPGTLSLDALIARRK